MNKILKFNKWWLLIPILIAFTTLVLMKRSDMIDQHYDRIREFYVTHECVRIGFVGKDAESVYQCNNGMWRFGEVWDITLKENND